MLNSVPKNTVKASTEAHTEEVEMLRQQLEICQAAAERSQQEAQQLKEELADTLLAVQMAPWEINLQNQEVHFSEEALQVMGFVAKDQVPTRMPLAQWLQEYLPKESAQYFQKELQVSATARSTQFRKELFLTKIHPRTQKEQILQLILRVRLNEEGKVGTIKAVMKDVTLQHRYENIVKEKNERLAASEEELRQNMEELQAVQEVLEQNEARLFNFLNKIPIGVFIVEGSGRPYFANERAKQLLGKGIMPAANSQELVEVYQAKLSGSDVDYPAEAQPIVKALRGEESTIDNMEIVKGKQRVPIEVTASPIRNEKGKIDFAVAVFKDISRRQTREKEMKAKTEALMASEEELRQNMEEMQSIQEQLAMTQERFDLAMRGASDGIWDWDLRTNEAYMSPILKSMLGYEDHEIENHFKSFELLAHPEDMPKTAAQINAYIEGKSEQYRTELRMRRKDGSYAWILSRGMALRDAQGKAYRLVGSHTDITERKEMEAQLKEQNSALAATEEELRQNIEELHATQEEIARQSQQIQALIDASNDYIMMVDESYKITLLNRAIEENMAKSKVYIKVGLPVLDFVDEAERAFTKANLSRAFLGESFKVENEQTIGGQKRYIEVSYFPVYNAQKGVRYAGIFARDITEDKQHAMALHAKNEELARKENKIMEVLSSQIEINEKLIVAERKMKEALETEQIRQAELNAALDSLKSAQTQLVHNEKMASLGQLTAGIAHEINNPINFVYNGIENLKMAIEDLMKILSQYEKLDNAQDKAAALEEVKQLKNKLKYDILLAELKDLSEHIKKGAIRTIEIVKGLRVFSRLDEEEQKKANVHECLDSTLILLKSKMKDRISLQKYYDEAMPEINCYPGQLNQVFMNILNNAIQAIPADSKEGKIEIYTEQTPAQVVIRIKDNGIGMSEQVKKRIFEPFFTTKDVGIGTGLGLSISFGIIKKHNGLIEVHSQEGKGTEFALFLPKNLA